MLDFLGTHQFQDFTLVSIVDDLIQLLAGAIIPLAIAVVFFVFVYTIVKFIISLGNSDKRYENASRQLLYPVLAIATLFLLWGIIFMLRVLFTGA